MAKKFLLLFGFSFLAVISFGHEETGDAPASFVTNVFAESPKSEPSPKLTLLNPVHDFGEVPQGEKVQHEFKLRNDGNAPLKIHRVFAACGCTATVLESDTIAPGKVASVKATFDSSGFEGYKVKTIRLHTNDPFLTSAVLTLEGNVISDITVDPKRVNFGVVQRGEVPTKSITIKPRAESGVKIISVKSRSKGIFVSSDDTEGSESKTVTVTLKDDVDFGLFRGRIVAKTTSKQTPILNIPVFAKVQGDLALEPPDISLGMLQGPLEEDIVRSIKIVNRGQEPIAIKSVTSDNSSVVAEVDEANGVITVTTKEGTVGTIRARVTVETNHPDPAQQEIILPVYGIVSRSAGRSP